MHELPSTTLKRTKTNKFYSIAIRAFVAIICAVLRLSYKTNFTGTANTLVSPKVRCFIR